MSDPYEVLGLTPDATDEEIREAYRAAAQQWHPDKHPDDVEAATRRFQEIAEAYSVLSDESRRAHFDDLGEVEPTNESALTARAISLLTTADLRMVDELSDHVPLLRGMCEGVIEELEQSIASAHASIRGLHAYARRWHSATGRNIFANAARREVRSLVQRIRSHKDEIELNRECLRVLEDYVFAVDHPRVLSSKTPLLDAARAALDRPSGWVRP